jgi:hypothetical protein
MQSDGVVSVDAMNYGDKVRFTDADSLCEWLNNDVETVYQDNQKIIAIVRHLQAQIAQPQAPVQPASEPDVEAMCKTLCEIADDLGANDTSDELLKAAAMLRSLSVDAIQKDWHRAVVDQCMVTEAVSFKGEPSEVLRKLIDYHVELDRAQRAQPQVEPTVDERDEPSPQRRDGPWPTAIEPKTRKVDLQVEPLHLEDWIRREPERAQPQVEPTVTWTVDGVTKSTPVAQPLPANPPLYTISKDAGGRVVVTTTPQVELLEIIRTARGYIGILEGDEEDPIAKAFLAKLYAKMTEAIKPILP